MPKYITTKRFLAILLIAFLIASFWDAGKLAEQGDRAQVADLVAICRLSEMAKAMIAEGGPDIRGTGNDRYIASFSAFFDFVAKKYPSLAGARDDPNPFPGLLPAKSYTRLAGVAQAGSAVLICSEPIPRHQADITHFVHCDGNWGISTTLRPWPPPVTAT